MARPHDAPREVGRHELSLFAIVFLGSAYFYNGVSSNQNARLDAMFAFVEPGMPETGTFRIDRFLLPPGRHHNTTDWTFVDGHYYANKAPGEILLVTALYLAMFWARRLGGLPTNEPRVEIGHAYMVNLLGPALLLAFGAVAFARALQPELGRRRAAFVALGLCLGTALFPYSTQLWGHVSAGACVALGLAALRQPTARGLAVAGFCFGWATCSDYLAGIAAVLVAAYCLVRHGRGVLAYLAGTLPPALCLLAYQWYCFGDPFHLTVQSTNPAYVDAGRTLGLFALPDPAVWVAILFGAHRGVLLHMPFLAVTLVGLGFWAVRTRRDPLLWLCASVPMAATLAVSSFNGWHGGATVCQRYLIAFLPFFVLPAKEIPWNRAWCVAGGVLGAVSVLNMLAVAAVSPIGISVDANPLYGVTYRLFLSGELGLHVGALHLHDLRPDWPELRALSSWNWGRLAGLEGLPSLAPLALAWGALGAVLWRSTRSERTAEGSPYARPASSK